MKAKKFILPAVILAIAVLAMGIYCVLTNIAQKPAITENTFAFSITYEQDGETITITDQYNARYTGNDGYTDTKTRVYTGQLEGKQENDRVYILRDDENGRIVLDTNFYADYLMGDPEYDYFDDRVYGPELRYYDSQEVEYTDRETLLAQGVKLISWKYPEPIENTLVFSHISILDHDVVLPTALMSLLALIATLIFVKKEQDLEFKTVDVICVTFRFILGILAAPLLAFLSSVMDVVGGNEHICNQILYFTSAMTILGIAASVTLGRKGYGKAALLVQFVGPAVFVLCLLILG